MKADQQIRILCVDDEKNVLRSLERLFLDSDYDILTSTSGEDGLNILKESETIQLVISDYRMPGMNGVDFLKEVYTLKPDTVRIVLSGYADTASIVEAINEGQIYKFIPKPWNDEELKINISKALEYYLTCQRNIQLTRELETKNQELHEINNNLERLIEDRTKDLLMQNKILTSAQNILDSLPMGVVGIDPEGLIVQCNKKGLDLFRMEEGNILGMTRLDSFPDAINTFIEKVQEENALSGNIKNNGSDIRVNGVHMKYSSGQEGIILVFNEGGDDKDTCQ